MKSVIYHFTFSYACVNVIKGDRWTVLSLGRYKPGGDSNWLPGAKSTDLSGGHAGLASEQDRRFEKQAEDLYLSGICSPALSECSCSGVDGYGADSRFRDCADVIDPAGVQTISGWLILC